MLLGVVAVVLIARNRAFLLGEAIDDDTRTRAARRRARRPRVDRVTFLHMEYIGPGFVLLIAAVDLVGDRTEADVALELRRLEAGSCGARTWAARS